MRTVITPSENDTRQKPDIIRIIYSVITCAVFSLGTGLVCTELFPSLSSVAAVTAVCLVDCIIFILLFSAKRKALYSITAFIIYTVLFIVLYRKITDGAAVLFNDITHSLTDITRLRHGIYEITDVNNGIFALSAVLFPLSSLYAAAADRNDMLPVIPVGILLLAACFSGLLGGGVWLIFFTAAILLVRFFKGTGQDKRSGFSSFALLFITGLILFSALRMQSKIPTDTENITEKLSLILHENIYGCKTDNMPEGRLYELTELKENNTPALETETDGEKDIYLRGFTGEYYTGKAWKNSPDIIPSDNSALFYWMHKNDLYGENLKGKAESLVDGAQKKTIKINLLNTCKKYALAPVDMVSTDMLNEDRIGDGSVINSTRSYETEITESCTDPFTVQTTLLMKQGNEEIHTFLSYERAYADFVYKYYLALPEDTKNSLAKIFTEDTSLLGTKEKIALVREKINEYMFYNPSPVPFDGRGDFLTDLFSGKGGHSIHYATAQALMLRYLGVPTRYAEGYILKAENAVQGKNTLTENNAAAWTEVYIDGVGWCVFDLLPTENDSTGNDSSTDNTDAPSVLPEEETAPDTVTEPERTPTDDQIYIRHSSFLWLPILLPLLILLIFVIKVRLTLKKKIKKMEKADNKTAVPFEYGYITLLLSQGGHIGEQDMEKAEKLNNEAVFSTHDISDTQRTDIKNIRLKAVESLKKNCNVFRKLILKFVKGIY